MKYSNLGIGLLLFAILLEMCSSGLSALSLCLGVVGLVILVVSSLKPKDKYKLFVRSKGVIGIRLITPFICFKKPYFNIEYSKFQLFCYSYSKWFASS